jgi:hypothetical protein
MVNFHLRLFRFRINAARRIFSLRRLFVFFALLLVGWLFHDRLDGECFSSVAPAGFDHVHRNFFSCAGY